jgi:hypothetical protein
VPDDATMTEAESFRRGIYPYSVGGVSALGDPLKILNAMYLAEPRFDELVARFFAVPDAAEGPEAAATRGVALIDAATALGPAVLAGFRLQPLADDGSGASTTEAMALLADFLGWQARADAAREAARALAERPEATAPITEAVAVA